jgi:hypothetical protein
MASLAHDLLPSEFTMPSDKQRLFTRFFSGSFVDLIVLGLFADFSGRVYVDSFTTLILAAILLQILLKITVLAEHRILGRLKDRGKFAKIAVAWIILIGSKFLILGALSLTFGENVHFIGFYHGVIWLIVVAITMLVVEELVARFYRTLG